MFRKLVSILIVSACLASLVGCGGGDGPERVETPESAGKAAEAANGWSAEQKTAMQKALSERRNEEGPSGGSESGSSRGSK